MARRAALLLVLAAVVVGPAGADTIADRKSSVDARLARLSDRVARMQARESSVRTEIAAASARIRVVERQVGDVSTRLAPLERELELRQVKLERVDTLLRLQTARLGLLETQRAIAQRRLGGRLVALYETEAPDTIAVVLSARSFTELLDSIDYLRQIGRADKRIADEVRAAKVGVARAHVRTAAARTHLRQERRLIALRVSQARTLRDRLASGRESLLRAQNVRRMALARLTATERGSLGEMEALQAVSESLAARIRAEQTRAAAAAVAGSSPAPVRSSSGALLWPVDGPVTSPFGWRWGRMHEGIDIGVGYGTPIHAAASGSVIYAGWMSGYGNLVVLDHGDGLATAYGHQSQLAVSIGQSVSQGQVIGYVGSTGHSTGPHLHFEVRVDGSAVDPLGYL